MGFFSPHFCEYLRACPVCGFGYGLWGGFCQRCRTTLLKAFEPRLSLQHDFPVFYGWLWEQSRLGHQVGRAIKGLKGGWAKGFYRELAYEFSRGRSGWGIQTGSLLIPAPPSQTNRVDHAMAWAHALGEVLDLPVSPCLQRCSGLVKQGMKTRKERQELQLELRDPVDRLRPLVLIDDLVTTGATVKAAYRALARPPQFQVWALSCRALESLV